MEFKIPKSPGALLLIQLHLSTPVRSRLKVVRINAIESGKVSLAVL
jgi:hypothetical protein